MKRALLALVDRGGTSLGSLVLLSLVARNTSAAAFGQFAFLMALAVAAQSAYRSVPGSWLIVSERPYGVVHLPPAALQVAGMAAASAGLVIIVAGRISGAPLGMTVAVAALSCAAILVDTPRLASYGARDAVRPAMLTLSTLVVFGLAAGAWTLAGEPLSTPALVVAYGLALLLPGVLLILLRPTPDARGLADYLRANRPDVGGQAASAASSAASQVLVPTLLQVFAGPSLVGAVRGAQSLASIPAQLPTALQPVLLADTSRKHQRGMHPGANVTRWALMVSLLFAAAILVALFVPDSLGVRFFGESWPGIDQALIGILLSTWATSCLIAVEALYRVQRSMARLSMIRLLGLILVCLGSVIGAEVAGARGAAFGLALANITVLAVAVAARPAQARAERVEA